MTQPPGPSPSGPSGNPWATPPAIPPRQQPAWAPPPASPSGPPASPPASLPPTRPPSAQQPQQYQQEQRYPQEQPPVWLPPYEPPRRRRGLLVAVIVLVVLLAVGGVGAFLLLHRTSDGNTGKDSPTDAAQAFLTAVYQTRDANAVAPLVCAAARDRKKIQTKIDQLARQDKQYQKPTYDWTPPTTQSSTKDRAVVATTVTVRTEYEQAASQKLKLTVIHSTGWFVCDVQAG